MCIFGNGGTKAAPLAKDIAPPDPVAEAAPVGSARKAEDQALYGGTPDLRVDRSATKGGVKAKGTGLKVM